MKKAFLLTGLSTILLGFTVSCSSNESESLSTPTGLASSEVTDTKATLTWNAVQNAESYNVQIDDSTPVNVTATTHPLTGLTAETEYKWKVQAVKGELTSEWSAQATFTTLALTAPAAPTVLVVSDVSYNGATFTWTHDDDADSHEVVFNDGTPVTVSELPYTATDLDPETVYSWKVRSIKSGVAGEWATGEEFETRIWLSDLYPLMNTEGDGIWWGDERYGAGTNQFIVNFTTFDPNDELPDEGYDFMVDFVTGPLDMTQPIFDIPEGVYTFTEDVAANTVVLGGDYGMLMSADYSWFGVIESGTMTVAGDHTNYKIDFDLVLADREFHATWVGPITIYNS